MLFVSGKEFAMLEMFFFTGILLAIIFALCGNYCFTWPPVILFFFFSSFS